MSPKLKTLELWISRSMLNHIFFNLKIGLNLSLYPEKGLKFDQPEGHLKKPEQPIRSRKILKFWRANIERTLIGRNKVVISKKREKERIEQKS